MLLQGQHDSAVKGPFGGGRACAGGMAGWLAGMVARPGEASVAAALLAGSLGETAREALGSVTPTVVE